MSLLAWIGLFLLVMIGARVAVEIAWYRRTRARLAAQGSGSGSRSTRTQVTPWALAAVAGVVVAGAAAIVVSLAGR